MDIPVEVLRNQTAKNYMYTLFNMYFENGMVPNLCMYGIVIPISKNSTADPKNPFNYRRIVLASAMYK